MSNSNMRGIDVIEAIETDLGKPVVTANQASVWYCLRLMGINDPIEGYGRLMKL